MPANQPTRRRKRNHRPRAAPMHYRRLRSLRELDGNDRHLPSGKAGNNQLKQVIYDRGL
jgi:hypothetical protein